MAHPQHTPTLASLEEAITVLFCLVDDTYTLLNPGWQSHESLKRLSDSEVLRLALFQQLRGVESERSFLRDAQRFFSHLFPGIAGLHPSSLHRRMRKLRRFLEPLRRTVLPELVGEPESLIIDSTLLEVLHPRQVSQSAGFQGAAWVRLGSFAVYGVKLHFISSTNRVPISYELTEANVADVLLVRELQARLRDGAHAGQDAHWVGDQDRGEGRRLHLRAVHQPAAGSSSRPHQGALGLTSSQHSSRRDRTRGWAISQGSG
jgi:hypothetical protein